jgi:SAM-dependent methyltransferase
MQSANEQIPEIPSDAPGNKARLRLFSLVKHLTSGQGDNSYREHLKIGLQNFLASFLIIGATRTRAAIPAHYKPRGGQFKLIQKELFSGIAKDRFVEVLFGMTLQATPKLGNIDWMSELAHFRELDYPDYYLQPYHSMPGGWLNPSAAVGDRAAMESIYRHAHPRKSLGMREAVAEFFPEGAKLIYDLGAGTGDQSAAVAKRLPACQLVCVEASPFMIVVGKRTHQTIANMRYEHGMAEDADVADGSVDAVNLSLVFHEIPNFAKHRLLERAFRMLKPGGKIVLSDVPPMDLDGHRGFFEPYRLEWQSYDPGADLASVGFRDVRVHHVVAPRWLWTRTAQKPK